MGTYGCGSTSDGPALADEADEHFESLVSDDEIDGKIDTIEAEQQAIAKKAVEASGARSGDPAMLPEARTELTRTRVQLPSGDYHELADGALTRVETDWLARYDRMRSQDARSLKVDADLRALEVRRRALLHREHAREVAQVQLDARALDQKKLQIGTRLPLRPKSASAWRLSLAYLRTTWRL